MSNMYCNAATTSGTTNDFLQNKYIQKVDATGMITSTVRTTVEKKRQNNKSDGNQASKQEMDSERKKGLHVQAVASITVGAGTTISGCNSLRACETAGRMRPSPTLTILVWC